MAATTNARALALAVLPLIAGALAVFSSPSAVAAAREAPLSRDFHAESCPQLESIVRSSVKAALRQEIALAAGLLRIFFHDCFPQGCDASVYLNVTDDSELNLGPNLSLQPRALHLVDDIRAKVHKACGPIVSCADISALATYYAVVLSGGPSYPVLLGQLDSINPAPQDLVFDLPSPSFKVPELLKKFSSRGLDDPADLVALSGGHTIGRAQCSFVRPEEDAFSRKMAANCSRNPKILQDLDVITPNAFDNGYYKALTLSEGVFTSDMALLEDPRTRPFVRLFARDKAAFFAQFADSMAKLSQVPRPGGNVGVIRRFSCFTSAPRLDVDAATGSDEEGFAASA